MDSNRISQPLKFNLKNVAFLRFFKDEKYDNIISPFTRVYYIQEGHGYLLIGGERVNLEPECLYLIPSFTPCTYLFHANLAHYYIHFSIALSSGLDIYNLYSVCNKIKAYPVDKILFKRCVELNPDLELPHHDPAVYQKKPWVNREIVYISPAHYLETLGILSQLFSRFLGSSSLAGNEKVAYHTIKQALTYIRKNLNDDLSVTGLAEMSFICKDHFTRLFKALTGLPPSEFIIRKRIEKAKFLLLTTDYSMGEIIEQAGFSTVAYFCRVFKKYTTYTPSEFRKKRG